MAAGTRGDDSRYKRLQNLARKRFISSAASCSLCGRPIDYELRYPHPWSFVVDHVIPLAKGGKHEMNNLRAAHRKCNSSKGARIQGGSTLRRSGSITL